MASMKFGACGTYRDNRKGCPSGRANHKIRKRHFEMDQRGPPALCEVDGHVGGVGVLHNLWWDGPEESEGWRWTLGSERHSLPHPHICL